MHLYSFSQVNSGASYTENNSDAMSYSEQTKKWMKVVVCRSRRYSPFFQLDRKTGYLNIPEDLLRHLECCHEDSTGSWQRFLSLEVFSDFVSKFGFSAFVAFKER